MSDPLEGYRGFDPLVDAELGFLRAAQSLSIEQIEAVGLSEEVQAFFTGPVGKYVIGIVNEIEAAYLEATKRGLGLDTKTRDEFESIRLEYLIATRAMLWLGEAIEAGSEASAAVEAAIANLPLEDTAEPGEIDG